MKFTTLAVPGQTVYDPDDNQYQTILIGNQVWMTENLKTSKYRDGTPIPLVTDYAGWSKLTAPGYCWYNNDENAHGDAYGALYNWYMLRNFRHDLWQQSESM